MIRIKFGADGSQDIKKVCNVCKKAVIQDLQVEDILVKGDTDLNVFDKDGNEITRTKLPDDLVNSVCEDCK